MGDIDCPLGKACEQGQCVTPALQDSGPSTPICTTDADCQPGEQCVPSIGKCLPAAKPDDAGLVDAGPPPQCSLGLKVSCGESKLGECRLGLSTCEAQPDGTIAFSECRGSIGPTPEVCDGKDNDCDGLADEGLPDLTCGTGACRRTAPSCVAGQAGSCVPGPTAPETCDGLDNDCNGSIDEGLIPLTCGIGVCARSSVACQAGQPQVCMPGMVAIETCNGFDDDCNALVDDGLGSTTCGVGACARTVDNCVGSQPQSCAPGQPTTETCNGLDDDCDGQVDDGLGSLNCGLGVCARTVPVCVSATLQVCTPGVPGTESCNGLDDDCDGQVDEGLPAVSCGIGACARTVAGCAVGQPQQCTPGTPSAEACNGLDDDCDGQVDEGLAAITCGQGICRTTVAACVGGQPQVCTPGQPSAEACNGLDDDCDGQIDEGCQCTDGAQRSCYSGPQATLGVGACHGGTQVCAQGAWGACTNEVVPATEVCNLVDDDCDGETNENLGTLACGTGVCARSTSACIGGIPQTCTPGQPATESCNGVDDDCDGQTDEGLGTRSCGVGACARTIAACAGGSAQTCVPGAPSAETCDGVDNDCDMQTDEELGSASCGVGACARTTARCVNGVSQTCMPGAPSSETCNGVDDDCDTQTDEGFGPVSCGLGVCARTMNACMMGSPQACVPGTAGTESCNGLDDDCDGQTDEGVCGPAATCPAGRTVNPNTTVTLATNASSPVGRPVSCAWSVVSRPTTSNGTFSAPTSCTSSTYFADVVGTHTLRFTTTDSAGLSSSCTVAITVVALGDLWVELTWSVNNDMDLHLLHPNSGNSHQASAWSTTLDCHFRNRTPSWDAPGTADDPSLDRDDIPGRGPENTRINVPSTAHPYTIGVHMFTYRASPTPVTATLRLYCGGVLKTQLTRTFNTVKQMWVVGQVDFAGAPAGGCTFTPDGFTLQVN